MASKWYVSRRGNKVGPFTSPQLRKLALTGQLQPGDLVRKQGKAKWVAAATIKRLFPGAAPTLAASPAPRALAAQPARPTLNAQPGSGPRFEELGRLRKVFLVSGGILLALGVVSGFVLKKVAW